MMNLSVDNLNNGSSFDPSISDNHSSSQSPHGFWTEINGILVTDDVKAHCEYKLSQYNFLAEKIKWANNEMIKFFKRQPNNMPEVKVLKIITHFKTVATDNKIKYIDGQDFVKIIFDPMIKCVEEININMEPDDFIFSVVEPIINSYKITLSIEKSKPVSLMILKGLNDKKSILGSIPKDIIGCIITNLIKINFNFYHNFQSFPDFSKLK